MSIVGHSEIDTTNVYLRKAGIEVQGATEKLGYALLSPMVDAIRPGNENERLVQRGGARCAEKRAIPCNPPNRSPLHRPNRWVIRPLSNRCRKWTEQRRLSHRLSLHE